MCGKKKDRYDIFLIHKESEGIISELIYTDKIFNSGFLSITLGFKHIITSNSIYDFLDFIETYSIESKKLIRQLYIFFNLKFKKILFSSYFCFKVIRSDGKIDIKTKIYEFLLNIYLYLF